MAKSFNDILNQKQSFVKTVTPQSVSISDIIKQEEADTAQSNSDRLTKYFSDRSNVRKSMANGTLRTGRPAEDAFNVRTGKLIDLYLDTASKKTNDNGQPKFTTEQIIAASKDLPGTLNKMKQYYQYYKPDKVWAIDDYIQKGGVATNVFEYLEDISGNVTNPYGVKKQEKENLFTEETPETAKGVTAFGSFIPSMGVKSTGMFGSSKLGKWMDEKLYDTYHKVWDSASDEEYRKYKSGTLGDDAKLDATNMGGINKRQLYEGYDNALKNGFVGSIDEYKNFEKNIHNTTTEALNKNLKEGILTEDDIESSKAAIVGDAVAEFLTYMAMPITKSVEIDTARPLLNMIATAGVDSVVNTLEYAALEGLQGDLETEDIGNVGLMNFLISGIIRSPAVAKYMQDINKSQGGNDAKFVRKFLSTLPEKVENAFKNMSSDTLEELWKFAKKEASNPEARGLGTKWLGEKGVKAVENIQKDTDMLGKQYEEKISGLTEQISEKGFFKEINDKFDELANQGAVSWNKNSVPKLELVKDGNAFKVKITNKKNLNKIKNEDGKGLGDAIQENVDSILEGYGIGLNKGSQYLIKQGVRNATKGTKWNVYEKQTQKLIEGLDSRELDMPKEVKDLGDSIHEKKKLLEMAQKDLGGIKGRYEPGKIGGWERAQDIAKAGEKMSKDDAIAIIDILKSENYLPQNIDSEIVAQGYLLGMENKNAGYSFLSGFYPSKAGEIEQILELLRQKATARDVERYIKLLKAKETGTQGAGTIAEMPEVSDAWRTMQKVAGYGAGKTELGTSGNKVENKGGDYTIRDWDEYNRLYREYYGD